jgi:hypothetical protein
MLEADFYGKLMPTSTAPSGLQPPPPKASTRPGQKWFYRRISEAKRREDGRGSRELQGLQDRSAYGLHLIKHLMVPKPQDTISPRCKIVSPSEVFLTPVEMWAAIQLDDQPVAR